MVPGEGHQPPRRRGDEGVQGMSKTGPTTVACALSGRVVSARTKRATRRGLLQGLGFDQARLKNIDEVDAALCALTALRFVEGRTMQFGNAAEGFIVVPA